MPSSSSGDIERHTSSQRRNRLYKPVGSSPQSHSGDLEADRAWPFVHEVVIYEAVMGDFQLEALGGDYFGYYVTHLVVEVSEF